MKKLNLYNNSLLFKILFWIALLVSYIAAVLPQDMAPQIGSLNDKGHHVLAFTTLSLLLRYGYSIKYWYVFFLLLGYGIFIEISQLFAINRYGDVQDVLADTVGIFTGLTLHRYLKKF